MRVTHKNGIEDQEENIFSQLLFRYMPYWALFLALLVLCLAGAFVYLHYAIPVYETSASILVKDEKKGLDDSNLMEQLDLFGSKKLVENEIEVIQSRMLMRQVVRNLSLYAPVTYKGKVKDRSAYLWSPVTIQLRHPDSLIERKKIFFTYDSAQRQVIINQKGYHINEWASIDSIGQVMFLQNPNYQAPEINKPLYFSLVSVKEVADGILDKLKTNQATKLSSVIDLKLKDQIPKRGEDILNTLIAEYNKAAINDKNALAYNTLSFINQRLRLVTNELDSVESNIQRYKTDQGIVDISAQGQLYLDNVGANDQKLSAINVQLAVMDQVEKYVTSKDDQASIVPSTFGVDNPDLSQLLVKFYDLQVQYVGLRKTTGENSPLLVSLRNQIDHIKPDILEAVHNVRRNLDAGKGNLSNTSNQYASILKTLPEKEKGLVKISRQQAIKNGIYSFLLQKREETALSYNSAVADTRLVDDADSTVKPVSPIPILVLLLAAIASFCMGAGIVAIREVFTRNIIFRKEIEQYTSVPVIAEVMYAPSDKPFVVEEGGKSFVAEQFRHLRTSLAYIGINNRKKKILITSAISGEGKSFIASNLALTLALTNKKVVLIELDLRKPKLSKIFNISRETGITNYFTGTRDADHIIKATDVNSNLFLIPSGAIPPNPSELILNGKLEELLKYLETTFDYIIIDSAPTRPVTDAFILSQLCDATIYIVRHGVTPKVLVRMLDENTTSSRLKNLAIVFNGVKNRGMGRYDYGYGYGYNSDSYGYAEDGKKNKKRKSDRDLKKQG
jgi:tyrosine-protein kinase Etk/Wzc